MSALIIDVPAAIIRASHAAESSRRSARAYARGEGRGRERVEEIHKRGGVGPSGQSAFN